MNRDWQTHIFACGLVAVPLPDYIPLLNSISRYCHSLTFRQIHTCTSHDFYKYSFYPLAIVQWNALLQNVVCLPTQFIQGSSWYTAAFKAIDPEVVVVSNLILNSTHLFLPISFYPQLFYYSSVLTYQLLST